MKDYLWIIIAGVFALFAFVFFLMTIGSSSSLIKKLKLKKANIIINIFILLIGISNLGLVIYLLQDIREQIDKFSSL